MKMDATGTTELPEVEFTDRLRAACFLDHKGRIVTDSLLWKTDESQYFIDVPGATADSLLQHLHAFKLRRSKVTIADRTLDMSSHVIFGTLNAGGSPPGYLSGVDPRHPSLGMRVLQLPSESSSNGENTSTLNEQDSDNLSLSTRHEAFAKLVSKVFPTSPGNYELVRRLAGVAEGSELTGKIALETNQEHLQAVSFHKGCYLGQELTARVHHTGAVRKRILPLLLLDPYTEVPQAWGLASSLQQGRAGKKFSAEELRSLPTRLPRLSVLTAGNLVAITTGSIEPPGEAVDNAARDELAQIKSRAAALLARLETDCTPGAKIVDTKDGKTIGQIVAPPVKGTNVVLAIMRLESVGLLQGGVWSKTNKVRIGNGQELRYLPYLPLWWPDLDPKTGKARAEDVDGVDPDEVRDEDHSPRPVRMPKIEIEEIPLTEGERRELK
jgi:folate-binding protein YgfZ